VIVYANGEVRQEFSICFVARIIGGQVSVADDESTKDAALCGPEFGIKRPVSASRSVIPENAAARGRRAEWSRDAAGSRCSAWVRHGRVPSTVRVVLDQG